MFRIRYYSPTSSSTSKETFNTRADASRHLTDNGFIFNRNTLSFMNRTSHSHEHAVIIDAK